MSLDIPPPLTVRIAVRGDIELLVEAVIVIVLSLEPEEGETVSQVVPFRVIVQLVLEAIEKDFFSLTDEKSNDGVDTDKLGASWVILRVCGSDPALIRVMDAVRVVELVLAEVVTVTVPAPDPEAGETVSHDEVSLLTVQSIFDETVNGLLSPE